VADGTESKSHRLPAGAKAPAGNFFHSYANASFGGLFVAGKPRFILDLRRKRCQISRIFEAKRKAAFFSAPYGMARQPFQS